MPPPATSPSSGASPWPHFLGRFQVRAQLGEGGFGIVYRVTDPLRPGADLALKLLHPGRLGRAERPGGPGAASRSRALRILEELRASRAVEHPAVVGALEVGSLEGSSDAPYLLTELVEGRPLRPPMASGDLSRVAAELLSALEAIHSAGWRHGDIQPANVLVERREPGEWGVSLLDFGLAEELALEGREGAKGAGRPRYLSPEALKRLPLDHRADLYSLGVVIFECLRGAFSEPTGEHLARTRLGKVFEEACRASLPEPLGRLIRRMLEPDPGARLSSAREGLEILGAASRHPRAVPSFECASPIGRDAFVATLRGAMQAALGPHPRPQLLLVEGDRGLGKTRLLREAREEAFTASLRSTTWEEARARAAPPVAGGGQGPDVADAAALAREHESALDREAEVITQSLLREPVLLLADDLERRPEEDLRLLRAVVERIRSAREGKTGRGRRGGPSLSFPVVLLCAGDSRASSSAFRAAWKRLLDLSWATHHRLAPLSGEDCAQFLGRVLRPRRALGAFEAMVIADSAGRPGRLRQRLRELAHTGDLILEGGVWVCKRPVERGLPPLPGESDRARLEWLRLGRLERDVLGIASVFSGAGGALTLRCAAGALGVREADLDRALKALRGGELLPAPTEAIRMDRLRRAWVLRLAGFPERRRWRQLVAGAGDAPPALRCAEALRSRLEAPQGEAVLEAAGAGGRDAERLLALHAGCCAAPRAERARSARRLGELLIARGKPGRAEDVLEKALVEAQGLERARILTLLGESSIVRRDAAAAARWFEEAAEAAGAAEAAKPGKAGGAESREGGRILFGQAASALLAGTLDDALRAAKEGVRLWPELPQLHSIFGTIQVARGSWKEAGEALAMAIELARKRGEPREEASALTNHGRLLMRQGRLEEAASRHEAAAKGFERAGTRSEAANALMNLGAVLRRAGGFERSVDAASRSLAIWRELGDDAGAAFAECNLAILARELGLPGAALRRFGGAEEAARAAGHVVARELGRNVLVLENRALLAMDLGRVEEARALAGACRELTGKEVSPEEILLAARVSAAGEPLAEIEGRLESRVLEDRDAPGLAALANLGDGSCRAALRARRELERLAQASPRARFHLEVLRAEHPATREDGAEACKFLEAHAEKCPERDARRRALAAVIRNPGASGEARERARGLLRKLMDEVLYDLEPGQRDRYRGRPEIQEALEMAGSLERRDGSTADSNLAVLREVFRLNREILDEGNLERLVRRAVDAAMTLTGAERGVLLLRREGRLDVAAARTHQKDLEDPLASISRTVIERSIDEGRATVTTDAREDLSLRSIASVEELGLRSVLCVPLRLRGRAVGALYLDNPFERAVFDASDLELTESFCAQAMLAIRAAERRQQLATLLRQVRAANQRLHGELKLTRRDAERRASSRDKVFAGITGDSAAMRGVFQLIEAVGPTEISVLITGESGTGKELAARAIYQASRRADRPFVAENCAAVPQGLLESTLFGHVKGAFTGADSDRPGLFEMADGGTLFLDEIAEMPLELQTRLLRVLQEKEVRPIGSKRVIRVDVRVIAATNRNAREAVAQGKMREDLYYRLQGAEIHLPPLRERPEDIPLLVERFLRENASGDQRSKRLEPETLERLLRYSWPGNIRELENEVRRLAVLAPGEVIGPALLSPQVREGAVLRPTGVVAGPADVRSLAEVEREAILGALRAFGGHRGKAAAALEVSRSTLYLKLREIGYGG